GSTARVIVDVGRTFRLFRQLEIVDLKLNFEVEVSLCGTNLHSQRTVARLRAPRDMDLEGEVVSLSFCDAGGAAGHKSYTFFAVAYFKRYEGVVGHNTPDRHCHMLVNAEAEFSGVIWLDTPYSACPSFHGALETERLIGGAGEMQRGGISRPYFVVTWRVRQRFHGFRLQCLRINGVG
ncbi:MAG: hypothetical protein N2255_04895, partial [Kiritimatiellae bacterium]|nr:hypothetical protein [Kiritimatiellia bacterium]